MKVLRTAAALWGLVGTLALLSQAIYKLTPMALEPLSQDIAWPLVLAYVAWTVFMLWSEGYKGFHRAFSPRVVGRAAWLRDPSTAPRIHWVILAPLFCMGLIGSNRKRTIVQWTLVTAIVVAILILREVPQPWRGVVDAGVVAGLDEGRNRRRPGSGSR
jgi:hypothetical protein